MGYLSKQVLLQYFGGGYSYLSNPQYNANETMFELYKGKADIIFAGDSYTMYGHFDELLDTKASILNRGIGSDTAEGLYNRIDEIISHDPSKIFILIGANDLSRVPLADTLHFYNLIIDKIRETIPACEIYVQSVPPSTAIRDFYKEKIEMNKALEQLAEKRKCTWIDLYLRFFDENDNVIEDYISDDGVHLTGKGYAVWIDAIKPYIQ